jgi:phosphoserine phosphatase RsbU/P
MTTQLSDPSSLQPHSNAALATLGFIQVADSEQVAAFMEMAPAISLASEPKQVMDAFSRAITKVAGRIGLVTVSVHEMPPGRYRITRMIDMTGVNHVGTDDPWRHRDELPTGGGGFIGQVIATPEPKLAHHLHVAHDPVLGDALASYGSMMAVPAFTDGKATHWALQFKQDPTGFSPADLGDAILRVNLIGAAVHNVLINRQLREMNERMRDEVERIAAIQRALLPARTPDIPGLAIAASYQTYDTAGGDLYDFHELGAEVGGDARSLGADGTTGRASGGGGPWGIAIADASGHGPSAAVVMAMLQTIMHSYPDRDHGPAELLSYANCHLAAKRIEASFVTAFFAKYHPATHELTYARAGHELPLVMAPGQHPIIRLDAVGGVPLGVLDDVTYEQATYRLEPGQTLVLYTDGITEATGADGAMFGQEGIVRSLAECSGEPACVIDSITKALRRHESGIRPSDDQTIVAIKVKG